MSSSEAFVFAGMADAPWAPQTAITGGGNWSAGSLRGLSSRVRPQLTVKSI